MKLKNCKSCGKEIAKNARVCPHCGHKYSIVSGCFAFVLILFVGTFMIGYIVSNLSTNNKINSVNELVQRENAEIGELLVINRADKEFRNSDNSYIIVNFSSIKKHLTYKTNNNQIVDYAIVIENVTDITETRNFVRDAAYFVLFNEKGEEIKITNDIWTQTGSEFF